MRANDLRRRLRAIAKARDWTLIERDGRGSHVVVVLNGQPSTIPVHRGDMPLGTYRAILKQLGLTPEDMEG